MRLFMPSVLMRSVQLAHNHEDEARRIGARRVVTLHEKAE